MGNKMICCNELTPDQAQIEANLYREGKRELQRKKVLLLGAGSSGKSTLLKQMKYLYQFENDYPVDELFNFRRLVLLHILNVARTVCEQMEAWKTKCDEQSEDAMRLILSFDGSEDEEKISDNVISAVRTLWKDEEVLKVFEKRDEYTIYDNAEYFMSQLDRILAQDYRPTFADVVRTRVQTTGVIEQEFIYKGHESKPERYFIIDVGGQRSERSKWASQFSGVVAVLWVFALSSYDQKLFEQAEVNRMHEEFELFRDTSRNRAFEKINFIVLLNKHDQFQDKIERIPFECEFEEHKYKGGKHDGEKVIEWIKDTLRKLDAHESLYFHITTATDTDKFNTVFADCHEIILREQFRRAGAF